MQKFCKNCGTSLPPDGIFCEECGAPIMDNPVSTTPPPEPSIPVNPESEKNKQEKPPISRISRPVPLMYIAAAIGLLIIIGGSVLFFGGFLESDPVIGTWSYSKAPLTIWISFTNDKEGEIVIMDTSQDFYMDRFFTYSKTGKNEYDLMSSDIIFYDFTMSDDHDKLTSTTSSEGVLTRTTSTKPSAPSPTRSITGPRFIPGDIIDENPFQTYMYTVILAYDPSTGKYAADTVFADGSSYYRGEKLDYTEEYDMDFYDLSHLKLDHINLDSIEIR